MAEVDSAPVSAKALTGVILAGGLARRMGGVDKGLQMFQGRPLVEHTLQRLRPQVQVVGINANRSFDAYAALGAPIWPDATADFAGPLSGFMAGLTHCQTPYLLTVPCDTPHFPLDLGARLGHALLDANADIAMALAPEGDATGTMPLRKQPVFCLLKASLVSSLQQFMQAGGRKIDAWTAQHKTVEVRFDTPSDSPQSFFNINTLQELQALESPST